MPRAKRPTAPRTPQRMLDQRMLVQAVRDLRESAGRDGAESFASAARWVWGADDPAYGFSFRRVCERLGRQPDAVRAWAAAQERVSGVLAGDE